MSLSRFEASNKLILTKKLSRDNTGMLQATLFLLSCLKYRIGPYTFVYI